MINEINDDEKNKKFHYIEQFFKDDSLINNIKNSKMDDEYLIRPDQDLFDYFFKRHDVDVNKMLAVEIDDAEILLEYFSVKYPEFMDVLLNLKPLENERVKFMDIYDLGYGYYFGEWKGSSSVPIKHGRGLTVYEEGSKHIGYYENDDLKGEGTFIFMDESKIIINFVNGKMHGVGKKIKNGEEKEIEYVHGVLAKKWENLLYGIL